MATFSAHVPTGVLKLTPTPSTDPTTGLAGSTAVAFNTNSDLLIAHLAAGNPHGTTAAQVGGLAAANNLSDVASVATARTNLGLGTAAVVNTGTAAGNVPVLDSGGKIVQGVLPGVALNDTFVVASQTAMLALTAQTGDVAVRTDLSKTFILKGPSASTLSDWQELLAPTGGVATVNGQSGTVVLTKADVGLGNVDNTSDANKPVSTAQQTALNGKAASTHAHAAADTTSGVFAVARLGTGTPTAATTLRGNGKWLGVVAAGYQSTSYAADASAGNEFRLDIDGPITLANPTNPVDGQGIVYRVLQDSTGGHAVSFGTAFRFEGGVAPTIPTVADKAAYIACVYVAANAKWDVIGVRGAF